ncbi:MAG: ACT domain-containing protein [Cytophagales bacterium]
MKSEYTLELAAENNFSVLNRIINVLNRRRVRIKKLMAHENENDFRKGGVIMLLLTTPDMIEKVTAQLEKLIEVEFVRTHVGSELYFELSERVVDVD